MLWLRAHQGRAGAAFAPAMCCACGGQLVVAVLCTRVQVKLPCGHAACRRCAVLRVAAVEVHAATHGEQAVQVCEATDPCAFLRMGSVVISLVHRVEWCWAALRAQCSDSARYLCVLRS